MIGRLSRLCTLAMLAGAIGFGFADLAQAAPAAPTPDVIAPELLPALKAIRSDSAPAIAGNAPAPMPDADAAAPIAAPLEGPQVAPAMFFQKTEFSGNGMTAGSADHAREQQPATGVSVDVPLN